jgi:predicted nucleic acid-binding protein
MSFMRTVSRDILVDTNVLVYTHDARDRAKQRRAVEVLRALVQTERAVLSVQCLTEFFRAVTQRLPEPLTIPQARAEVSLLMQSYRVLPLTPLVVLEACDGVVTHQLALWDALIWAIARLNQVPIVLTEDAPHGRFLDGVTFLNPFDPAFNLV